MSVLRHSVVYALKAALKQTLLLVQRYQRETRIIGFIDPG